MASYKGDLYVGGRDSYTVYVYEGEREWKPVVQFPKEGLRRCFPYAMSVHNGRLYVGCPGVYSYGGNEWVYVGTPVNCDQLHSLEVYRGELYGGTWWEGKVALYRGGQDWEDCGRPGDSTEVQALTVYNGKFYVGSIPRAEVYRYEGSKEWSLIKRFFAPEGWEPAKPDYSLMDYGEGGKEWTRVTSLTVYNGKLFAGIGSCTCSILDAPCDIRGKVFCMEAGKCVSYDRDLGSGWKHIAAVKENGILKLYINGQLSAITPPFGPDEYSVSNHETLKIGAGEMDYFSGKIREVRVYNRALNSDEIQELQGKFKEDLL